MIGGIPASPETVPVPVPSGAAGAVAAAAVTLDRMYDRIADWADRQSLAPASAAGISLILGICAAGWFSAGTRAGNLYGAIALAVGYLVALGSREFLIPPELQPADSSAAGAAAADEVAGVSIPAGLVAGTGAARSGWLAMLGTRLSEYAVLVSLALGAAAEGWHGVWPLTIAVLGLTAVCDTMTVCSAVDRPAPAWSRPAPARPASTGTGVEDTIPDVPAWEGTAPDVVPPDGAAAAASTAPTPPRDDLPPNDDLPHGDLPRRGGPGHDGEPEPPGLGAMAGRVLLTALGMPPGGRVLLIALAAPVFGAQPTLVGLLDWGIIGVGYGIGSRTAARRRSRQAEQADQAERDAAGLRPEPSGLALLLQPARPAGAAGTPDSRPDDPQIPVLRAAPSPSETPPEPPRPGKRLGSVTDLPVPELAGPDRPAPEPAASDRGLPPAPAAGDRGMPPAPAASDRGLPLAPAADSHPGRAAYASELNATAAFKNAALAGEPSLESKLGLAHAGEAGLAQHAADSARRTPGAPPGRAARDAGPGPGAGSASGSGSGSGSGSADDAVYDWADDGWPDGGILDDDPPGVPLADAARASAPGTLAADAPAARGVPAGTTGTTGATGTTGTTGRADASAGVSGAGASGRGGATDAELADQDEWDAELAAEPQLPGYPEPGPQTQVPDYPPESDLLRQADLPAQSDLPAQPDRPAQAGLSPQAGLPPRPDLSAQEDLPPQADYPTQSDLPSQADLPLQPDYPPPADLALQPDYPPQADYPTLAERLGLGRSPEPAGPADASADVADTAEYPSLPAGSAAAQPGDPAPAPADPSGTAAVLRNRDDGTLARWFGSLVRGQLIPLPPALLALAAVAMLAHLGLRDLPGLLILAPALVMLVAAPGASHPHDGRFDWLAPAVLQGAQYVYIAALGFAAGVPVVITFVLCATVALHYADLGSAGSPILLAVRRAGSPQSARRGRPGTGGRAGRPGRPGRAGRPARPARPRRSFQERLGQGRPGHQPASAGAGQQSRERAGGPGTQRPPATELGTWMGWEGRMIAVGLGAAMGVAMFAYLALAGYLSWLIYCKVRASYLGLREGDVR